MEFAVDECNVYRLLLGFLEDRGMYDSLIQLSLESGVSLTETDEELSYLQDLVLTGRWVDVIWYLQPMRNVVDLKLVDFIVLKQNFLESLAFVGYGGDMSYSNFPAVIYERSRGPHDSEDGPDSVDLDKHMEGVVNLLKLLEPLCPTTKEYDSLCFCLTLESITDNPDFSTWSVSEGRWNCLATMRELLSNVAAGDNECMYKSSKHRKGAGCSDVMRDNLGDVINAAMSYYQSSAKGAEAVEASNEADLQSNRFVSDRQVYDTMWTGQDGGLLPTDYLRQQDQMFESDATCTKVLDTSEKDADAPIGHVHFSKKVRRRKFFGNSFQYFTAGDVNATEEGLISKVDAVHEPRPGVEATQLNNISAPKISTEQSGGSSYPIRLSNGVVSKESARRIRLKNAVAWTIEGDGKCVGAELKEKKLSQLTRRSVSGTSSRSPRASGTSGMNKKEHCHNSGKRPIIVKEKSREAIETKANRKLQSENPGRGGGDDEKTLREYITCGVSNVKEEVLMGNSCEGNEHEVRPARQRDNGEYQSNSSSPLCPPNDDGDSVPRESDSLSDSPDSPVGEFQAGRVNDDVEDDHVQPGVAVDRPVSLDAELDPEPELPEVLDWDCAVLDPRESSTMPELLYHSKAPLRCVRWMEQHEGKDESGASSAFRLAVGSNAKSIQVLSTQEYQVSGKRVSESEVQSEWANVHTGSVYCVDWNPALHLMASGSNDKSIRICNIRSGNMVSPMKGHSRSIRKVAFDPLGALSPTGQCTIASVGDNNPRIWDVLTGQSTSLTGHHHLVHGLTWLTSNRNDNHISSNDQFSNVLLTGCEGGVLIAHDIRMRTPAWTLPFPSNHGICSLSCACDAAGRPLVVAGCTEGFTSVVDVYSQREILNQQIHKDDVRAVSVIERPYSTACSANEAHRAGTDNNNLSFVTTSFDKTAAIWSISSPKLYSSDTVLSKVACLGGYTADGDGGLLIGHTDKVLGVDTIVHRPSHHSNIRRTSIITSGADGRVLLWRVPGRVSDGE